MLVGDNDDLGGVGDDALDFGVVGIAHDDDLVAFLVELLDEFLGAFDEHAGGVGEFEALVGDDIEQFGAAAVGADEDGGRLGVGLGKGDFVGVLDLIFATIGDPDYDPAADVTQSGIIGGMDLGYVKHYYNTACDDE